MLLRTWIRGLRREAVAAIVVATALLVSTGVATAAPHEIDAIVVKYRDQVVPPGVANLPLDVQQRLATEIQSGFADFGRTRDGAFRIMLNPPLTYAETREVLIRIRMDGSVLYANVVQSAAPASSGAGVQKSGEVGLPTTRIIVKYRDAGIVGRLLSGQPLDQAEVSRMTGIAGTPVAFVRAMYDGAAVMSLFQRTPLDQVHAIADRIAQQPDVEFAQPDYIKTTQLVPTDPCYASASVAACNSNYQWDLFDPVGGVNMQPAWDITTGSAIQRVAVIDTGYLLHPDLVGRLYGGYDFISDFIVANDNQPGQPANCLSTHPLNPFQAPCISDRDGDASDTGDWISAADNAGTTFDGWLHGCTTSNSSFHGTHVSGTIGAIPNNGMGVAGINWVSLIIPVRVLGKCGGYTSDISDAMVWASGGTVAGVPANTTPVRVMNLSLGGFLGAGKTCAVDDLTEQNAINTAVANGAVVVVAAGNSNADAVNYAPASCNAVITVAATTKNGGRASYSNFGVYVEIAAPGGFNTANDGTPRPSILSTLNSGTTSPDLSGSGWIYANYAGTSMATPHVAGIASLMLSIGPELTPGQVVALMQSTARAFPQNTLGNCTSGMPSGTTLYCGAGIIDAQAAVNAAKRVGGLARAGARRDFNGNDRSDLTWTNAATGEKVIWLMNGGAIAGSGSLLTNPNWQITQYGDFNGDGATDLIWYNSSTGETVMWLMNGASFAGGTTLLTSNQWSVIKVGDFNGDGRSDLLWRNSVTGEVVVWIMNGTQFLAGNTLLIDPNWIPSLIGDFNGDGKDDILWRNASTGETVIWLMSGQYFMSGGSIMTDPNWVATNVGDFNGDGKADILWHNNTLGSAMWLMNGTALMSGGGLIPDPNWVVAGVDDFNGDGKSDILWRNTATGDTAVWLMNGTSILNGFGLLPTPWQVTRTGDFNGDGMADIIWFNPTTKEKVMWLMNGGSVFAGYLLSNDPNWSIYP